MSGDIVEDNDGVIHDQPHSDDQTGEGDNIYSETKHVHKDKGYNDGKGNGEDDDQAGRPPAQEEKDYGDNGQQGPQESSGKVFDGNHDVARGIHADGVIDILGEEWPQLLQLLFRPAGHVHGIGT